MVKIIDKNNFYYNEHNISVSIIEYWCRLNATGANVHKINTYLSLIYSAINMFYREEKDELRKEKCINAIDKSINELIKLGFKI